MAVELEELSLYGLFLRARRTYAIREADFAHLVMLAAELQPIPIDATRLWRLGFSRVFTTGLCFKEHGAIKLGLKPGMHNRWIIQFDGIENAGHLFYIHQVQRLWFSHFAEHLWLPTVTPAPQAPAVGHQETPKGVVVVLQPDGKRLEIPTQKQYLALEMEKGSTSPLQQVHPLNYKMYELRKGQYFLIGNMSRQEIIVLLSQRDHRWDMVQVLSAANLRRVSA